MRRKESQQFAGLGAILYIRWGNSMVSMKRYYCIAATLILVEMETAKPSGDRRMRSGARDALPQNRNGPATQEVLPRGHPMNCATTLLGLCASAPLIDPIHAADGCDRRTEQQQRSGDRNQGQFIDQALVQLISTRPHQNDLLQVADRKNGQPWTGRAVRLID